MPRDEVLHRSRWDAMVGGGGIDFALAYFGRRRTIEIIDYWLFFPVASKNMFNLMPKVEPKSVDMIAFQREANQPETVHQPKSKRRRSSIRE